MFESIKTYEFLESIGIITLCASILTLIITGIIKVILKKVKVIKEDTEEVKKDIILSRVGRIVGLISYIGVYLIDVIIIKKVSIVIDVKLITSLLSGGTLTLIVSKGIYTMIRQMEKKSSIYEKLEVAEETISKLQEEINECKKEEMNESNEHISFRMRKMEGKK